jgi:hypothetical protein
VVSYNSNPEVVGKLKKKLVSEVGVGSVCKMQFRNKVGAVEDPCQLEDVSMVPSWEHCSRPASHSLNIISTDACRGTHTRNN